MKSILKNRRLILGSKSPRRSQLLKEMDIPFVKKTADVEEIFPDTMPVKKVAEYLAKLKATAMIGRLKGDDVLLCADSVVICEGKIYGKPRSKAEAKRFINTLLDNKHLVVTGICIADKNNMVSASEISEVTLGSLQPKEIKYYVDMYEPLDKAGAYGIQEWFGHATIKSMKGTYTNIMGLPMELVYDQLRKF